MIENQKFSHALAGFSNYAIRKFPGRGKVERINQRERERERERERRAIVCSKILLI